MRTKISWILSVTLWQSIYREFQHETNGFKADIYRLNDHELNRMKMVSDNFLSFLPVILTITKPQYHAEIKRNIAYLAELQALQTSALDRETAKSENIAKRAKAWVLKHEN